MFLLGLMLVFLVAVLVHEAAHVGVAIACGYHLRAVYLGLPIEITVKGKKISTVFWKKERNGVTYGVSWLMLGGGVDFWEKDRVWWHDILIIIAGPVSNLLLAFIPLMVLAGPVVAFESCVLLAQVMLQAMAALFTSAGVSSIGGPVSFASGAATLVSTMTSWVILFSMINVGLFVTNLLPIPAIDGGQIITTIIRAVVGEKAKKPIEIVNRVSFNLICFLMVLFLAMEIIFFLSGLL